MIKREDLYIVNEIIVVRHDGSRYTVKLSRKEQLLAEAMDLVAAVVEGQLQARAFQFVVERVIHLKEESNGDEETNASTLVISAVKRRAETEGDNDGSG